jgi:hypothetical protein
MQWLASDFWLNDERFSILGLELFYSKKEALAVLTGIKQPAKIALNYQLIFDFICMAGFYPGIASLCMLVREKISGKVFSNILFALATLQLVAWAFDIVENSYLLKWLSHPQIDEDDFSMYRNLVALKWIIALLGILAACVSSLLKNKKSTIKYT